MIVSPFTPLFFINRKTDGIESEYIQTFSTTDRILLQLIESSGTLWMGSAKVMNAEDDSILYDIVFNVWAVNRNVRLLFTEIILSPGYYYVDLGALGKSCIFQVTDNTAILEKTTLIQYSMHNNRQREDAIFFIDGMQYFFDFRVPGGFKDSNYTFGVESEQFVTDTADIIQLFALDSIQKKFTLGTSQGCPVWYAELLNRLLCCTYVYFDGVRYARKESSVPELNIQLEGVNSFVFTQNLQRVNNINPVIENTNQALIRRIDNSMYRTINNINNRLIN